MARKTALAEEGVLYVGVKSPTDLRRMILESSKDMIHFLQRFESFKQIRDEKRQSVLQLKNDIKDIRILISGLKKALPKTKLRVKISEQHGWIEGKKPKKTKKKAKKKGKAKKEKEEKPPEEKPKKITEIERLERELAAIEQKLKGV